MAITPRDKVKPASLAYVGPNMVRGDVLLTHGNVFRGGVQKHVRAAMEADSNLAALFVPVPELAVARKALGDSSSRLSKAYRAVTAKPATGA